MYIRGTAVNSTELITLSASIQLNHNMFKIYRKLTL